MGIKFYCPNGHKLNVKSFLAGKRGVCPHCGAKVDIPYESQPRGATQPAASVPLESSYEAATSGAHAAPTGVVAAAPTAAAQDAQSAAGQGMAARGTSVVRAVGATTPAWNGSAESAVGAPAVDVMRPHVTPVDGNQASTVSGVDPIAEAPNAVWYVRPPSGGQFGPAQGDVMRRWITEGRVSADSLVWREGWSDWQQAAPVFPVLSGRTGGSDAGSAGPLPAAAPVAPQMPGAFPSPAASSATSGSTSPYRGRRRGSKSLAMVIVMLLGLVSVGLLLALFFVLNSQITS